ncbi:hypothetical protein O3P69_005806 [Scylla paramamosain]|uniref:Uncharacterized protein n=1 Tax=Scylla paramamosain TaxID=85552 RepID=A0AAW0UAF4_SCYPA
MYTLTTPQSHPGKDPWVEGVRSTVRSVARSSICVVVVVVVVVVLSVFCFVKLYCPSSSTGTSDWDTGVTKESLHFTNNRGTNPWPVWRILRYHCLYNLPTPGRRDASLGFCPDCQQVFGRVMGDNSLLMGGMGWPCVSYPGGVTQPCCDGVWQPFLLVVVSGECVARLPVVVSAATLLVVASLIMVVVSVR